MNNRIPRVNPSPRLAYLTPVCVFVDDEFIPRSTEHLAWPLQDIVSLRGFIIARTMHNNIFLQTPPLLCNINILHNITSDCTPHPILRCF